MFNKPEQKPEFSKMEAEILQWWKDNDILRKSIDQRPADKTRTFYDGPITANGEPHTGHMLTFAMKDIIPKYWTMKGYQVTRSLGWDCQGIPVEYEVEKKLGFKEKKDIEKYGIAEFNKLCRESVMEFRTNIIELEQLMGRLTNSDEEYATMDAKYIESIWWSLKTLYEKGLLYEGFKVVPYSTRAGTPLSNAEVGLGGYKEFVDPAVTVEFPLVEDPHTILLAWTTTPWTLPTNLGLAVGGEIKYVKVKGNVPENTYIVAESLLDNVFKGDPYTVVGEVDPADLVGKEYIPPFDFFKGAANAHKIYFGDHVTTDSGTGIVHLAPYGVEDNDIFQKVGIQSVDVLDDQGDFTEMIPPYQSMNYREANTQIIEDLKAKDLLFRFEEYKHEMPMCWRTNTPLIYKPIQSWYIGMSTLRENLVRNNETINWVPEHVKRGRFGNWLAEIKDWAISRKRYWGTPLPVWKSASGKVKVIGSFAELAELSGVTLEDPHRPYVDDITFELDGEKYTRVPDVIDVWYDSGAMPFARFHAPFENQEKFEAKFPAQYIAEGIDQTRGWFYSLVAIATALFDKAPFENVVVNGFTLDDNGVKQSKSKKNYESPKVLIDRYGADAIRMNFYTSPIAVGEDASVSDLTVRRQAQEFMLPLWNTFVYLVTYASLQNWTPNADLVRNERTGATNWDHIPFDEVDNEMDAWILVKLQETIAETTKQLDAYNMPKASKALGDFLSNLSKWYIRRSRSRFAEGDVRAIETLYYVFVEFLKTAAPFVPFVTEYMYKELVTSQTEGLPESIQLTDYPVADEKFLSEYSNITNEMEVVRAVSDLGQNIRTTKGIKVRQPLASLQVKLSDAQVSLTEWMQAIIADELNVLDVIQAAEIPDSPEFASVKSENGAIEVALDTNITPELAEAGLMREITRNIQTVRKQSGMQMGEKVKVTYSTDSAEVESVIAKFADEIKRTVSAETLVAGDADVETKLNEYVLKLKVERLS